MVSCFLWRFITILEHIGHLWSLISFNKEWRRGFEQIDASQWKNSLQSIVSNNSLWSCNWEFRVQQIEYTLSSKNVEDHKRKRMGYSLDFSTHCAEEVEFWNTLILEAIQGFTTQTSLNNSPSNGAIRILQKIKILKLPFQQRNIIVSIF